MSDFLSSLRGAATRVFVGDEGTQIARRGNDAVRNSPEYKQAARAVVSPPQSFAGFTVRDSYSPIADAAQGRADNLMRSDLSPGRNVAEQARDTSLNVGQAFATGAINLLALGANTVSAPGRAANRAMGIELEAPGVPISAFADSTGNFFDSLKTKEAQDAAQAYEATSGILMDDNRQAELQAIEDGQHPLFAGATRIGRDAVDVGGNLLSQPQALGTGVAQGIGSLLLGGPVARGATGAVALSTKALSARGFMSPGLARAVSEAVEHGAMTASIAGMEAGGSYTDAVNKVMSLDHATLMENSTAYAQLIEQGMDPEQAKRRVADQAGSIAATIQAPVAAATGRLVSKFEAEPLARQTIKSSLANIGRETLEEGTQSFSGAASVNLGVRASANREQDLGEGVGRGLVEGAIFGAGTAGSLSGASAVANGPRRVAEAVQNTVKAIQAKGEQINAQNIVKQNTETSASVKDAVQASDPSTFTPQDLKEQEAHGETIVSLQDSFRFNPADYSPQTQGELDVINALDPNTEYDIFDMMTMAAEKLADKDIDQDDKIGLALMATGMLDRITDEHYNTVESLLEQVTPGGALAKDLAKIMKAGENISSNRMVQEALTAAFSSMDVSVDDVADISTPEGSKAAQVALNKAIFSPETIDPEVVERLLRHSDNAPNGEKPFTARQTAALRTKALLNKTLTEAATEAARLGMEAPAMVRVANEAQINELKDSGATGPSVMGHYQDITRLAEAGLTADAKTALQEFQSFAQSMSNKLAAVNASHVSREGRRNSPVDFQAYSRARSWHAGKPITIQSQTPTSIAFGQQVGVDAKYVVDSFNELARAYPELGVKPLEQVDLHPDLKAGPAKTVAQQTRERDIAEQKGQRSPKQEAPKQKETPVKEAEPVVQPEKTKVDEVVETNQQPKDRAYTAEQISRASDKAIQDRIDIIEGRMIFEEDALPNDAANLKLLKAERDAREDALFEEGKAAEKAETQPAEQEAVEEVTKSEAQPKTEVTEETAPVEEAKAPTMEEVFPDLIQDTNGDQLLLNGFTLNTERTRLVGEDALTSKDVIEALRDGEAFSKLTGSSGSVISPLISQAYEQTILAVLNQVFTKMSERLLGEDNFKSFREGKNPTNKIRTVSLRLLNLMTRDADGNLVFNEQIQYASVLALSDWLAQNSVTAPNRDKEKIAKTLGVNIIDVTDDLAAQFNGGIVSSQAVMGLTRKLEQFLGLKVKGDVPLGLSRGIIMSLAGELLTSALASGLVSRVQNRDTNKTFNFYSVNKKALGLKGMNEEGPKFAGQTTLIEQIVTKDKSVAGYSLNEPLRKVSPTLQHGGAPQTKEQDETQVHENEVPHTVNRSVLDLYRHLAGLNGQGIVELFGNGLLPETMNKNDKLSKESQNLSLIAAYDSIKGMVEHMQREADETGRELEEIKAFREYLFSSVNRLQQQGAYGDQSSKLTREAITPYGGTLDLTDPEMLSLWRRGLAQGLGIKVEIQSDETWETNLTKLLEDEAVQNALAQLQKFEEVSSDKLIEALKAALDPSGKKGISPVQVHALKSYADYLIAEDPSEFYTHVYIEADGKTDGPTNSQIYMRRGGFDTQMLEALRRGGINFSKRAIPLHEYYDTQEKPGDTYEVTATKTAASMKANVDLFVNNAQDDQQKTNIKNHSEAVFTVLNSLIGGLNFHYENGEFIIGRNQLKNPMTVSVYGSSAKGIAEKIAKELIGLFYEEVSRANALATEFGSPSDWAGFLMFDEANAEASSQKGLELIQALTQLTSKSMGSSKEGYYTYNVKGGGMPSLTGSAVAFTFSPAAIKSLSKAIQTFYVAPMTQAINKEMGSSIDGSMLIQESTNIMSVMAKAAFTKLMNQELEKAVAKADGLSPAQIKKILNKVSFLFPYMEGDTITVNVKGLAKGILATEGEEVRYASTLTSSMSTQLEIPMPAQAGVAGAAYVNIAYGDGRMIIKASPNLVGGRLHVFDGINTALTNARENGVAINKSVLDAIQTGTPFQDLLKSFTQLSETLNFDMFNDSDYAEIFDSLTPENIKSDHPKASVMMRVTNSASELKQAALEEQARQAVFARVHLSSDHMAALNAPASTAEQEGREDLSLLPDLEAIAQRLQDLYEEEMAKLVKEEKETEANPPKEAMGSVFEGLKQHATGVRVTNTYQLRELLNGLNIPAQHKQLARRALQALKNQKWTVVLGTKKAANAYTKDQGIPFQFKKGDHGLTAPNRKVVIVANNSSETLAHELIHAATIDRVAAFYADPSSVDQQSRDAIERLDALMIEWLSVAEDAAALRHAGAQESVWAATRTIVNLLSQGDQAGALNEFMAWNLTNQELVKLNSTIKVESRLAQIARSVIKALREMFGLPSVGTDMNSNIRFNTMLLMSRDLPTVQSQAADRLLRHSTNTRPDLDEIMSKMAAVVATVDKGYEKFLTVKPSEFAHAHAMNTAFTVMKQGFPMTNEEFNAFVAVVSAYYVDGLKNAAAHIKADRYARELLAQVKQSNMMLDPNSTDPSDIDTANDRISLFDGSIDVGVDLKGRSLLVPMFVALAATNSTAQKLFANIHVRDQKTKKTVTADQFARTTASNVVNGLMDLSLGIKSNQSIGAEVQKLVAGLIVNMDREQSLYNQALKVPVGLLSKANKTVADTAAKGLAKVSDAIPDLNRVTEYGKLTLDLLNKDRAEDTLRKLTSKIDEKSMNQNIRAFWSEIMGMMESNQDILELVKQARAVIHRVRQATRKVMPATMAKKFSRKLDAAEWAALHKMGQMDMAALLDHGMNTADIVRLMSDPAAIKTQLNQKEADIQRLFQGEAGQIIKEAKQLAHAMLGRPRMHTMVKRNALAIANRVGSNKVGSFDRNSAETKAIDAYISLFALENATASAKITLANLSAKEADGVAFTLSLIAEARSLEMDRVPDHLKYNIQKGYMPKERQGSFRAVTPDKVNDFTKAGYNIVGARQRGDNEKLYDAKSSELIYVATKLSAPSFKQGIMQTVRSTVFGLNATNGAQFDNPSGGLIVDPATVKRLIRASLKGSNTDKLLSPLYNAEGQIYAFERLVDPKDVDSILENQENAAVSVGQWMGRLHEERHAEQLNDVLIERLTDMFERDDRAGTSDEYYDLFEEAEKNPVIADALSMMNDSDIAKIREKMGNKFMVRKSLYENVIGYRVLSVGDMWTGNNNLKEEHREAFANFMTGLLGPEAYRRLTVAEQGWVNLMGDARVAIVVKSMLVPALNGMANFYQLMMNGIDPITIARQSTLKLRETHLYMQNELRYQELSAELSAAKGAKRPDLVRRIETELRKIEDLNHRLSIWPLIEMGELTQVTEGLTSEDMELAKGRIWDHISKAADKLPPAVKTAGRYAVVAKDTALFEGLARTVAYTDFVAKAVLYDHLVQKEKLDLKTVRRRIANEFVNYDLMGGRVRARAEELGLIWFWAYKLRIGQSAASILRNNPLYALLTGFVPGVDVAGTPIDDNVATMISDGRFWNSFGVDNSLRALALNPVAQIIG